MANINDKLADFVIEMNVRSLQVAKGFNKESQYILTDLQDHLVDLLRDADTLTVNQRRRLQQLARDVDDIITKSYGLQAATNNINMKELSETVAEIFGSGTTAIFGANIMDVTLNVGEVKTLAHSPSVLGQPANSWWKKQSGDLKFKYMQQIRQGILVGETNDELINRIIGKPTGTFTTETHPTTGKKRRTANRKGGIMDVSRRDAETLVRTSAQSVSNATLDSLYRENADIIKGVRLYVTLDGRTTDICMSLSGGMWFLSGRAMPGSPTNRSYPGPPTYHFNCRTAQAPMTFSFEELADNNSTKAKEIPNNVRASMDGEVAQDTTYEKWLKGRPVSFQKEQLTPGKWQLWNDGKIHLHQLTDAQLRPLSLAELRKKYAS